MARRIPLVFPLIALICFAASLFLIATPASAQAGPALAVDLLDRDDISDDEKLMFIALQGIANRQGPRIFLKLQRSDEIWMDWYRRKYGVRFRELSDPYQLLKRGRWPIRGYVVIDPEVPHTDNLAATYAAVEDFLPVTPQILREHRDELPRLPIVRDLRGKFRGMSVVEIYRWALENQWPEANHRVVANSSVPVEGEGGFLYQHNSRDIVIAERGFFFELASLPKFEKERELKGAILSRMPPLGHVYGWHTRRGHEGGHVAQVSSHNQLVLCATTSSNLSFHRHIEASGPYRQPQKKTPGEVTVERDKVYVSYIYSDGDSPNHFSRSHGYQWEKERRGEIPVSWEIQPLFADLAPGMLEYFYETATENDTFVASASGIGYTFPGTMSDAGLGRYLTATRPYLERTDTSSLFVLHEWGTVIEERVTRMYERILGGQLHGAVEGYWRYDGEQRMVDSMVWMPTGLPSLQEKNRIVEHIVEELERIAAEKGGSPAFVPIHVVKGKMSFDDLLEISERLDPETFKIVGLDELLIAFRKTRTGGR